MPYIPKERREHAEVEYKQPGDGNYTTTLAMCKAYSENPSYATIHSFFVALLMTLDMPGAYEAKADILASMFEFYRRVGAVHEDRAIARNGDLPEYQAAIEAAESR